MGCEHAQAAGGQSTPSQFEENTLSEVKRVIAVLSGKGGVGKSFVTGAIATELARRGNKVGILDADITGPSIPKMFGMSGRHVHALGNLMLPEISEHGVKGRLITIYEIHITSYIALVIILGATISTKCILITKYS